MAHTYFLAHASPDKPLARDLHERLTRAGVTCFLDQVDTLPGDDWDLAIPDAHRQTAATIVLVSPRFRLAYYLRDEVHTALRWARRDPSAHRVVPVFVDGIPDDAPYGLTIKQGLDLGALGIDGLVAALVELAGRLGPGPTVALAPVPPPTRDREKLFEALCRIQQGTNYFDQILTCDVPQAADQVPRTATSTPADRALALVQWAALQGVEVVERVWHGVERRAPATLR